MIKSASMQRRLLETWASQARSVVARSLTGGTKLCSLTFSVKAQLEILACSAWASSLTQSYLMARLIALWKTATLQKKKLRRHLWCLTLTRTPSKSPLKHNVGASKRVHLFSHSLRSWACLLIWDMKTWFFLHKAAARWQRTIWSPRDFGASQLRC